MSPQEPVVPHATPSRPREEAHAPAAGHGGPPEALPPDLAVQLDARALEYIAPVDALREIDGIRDYLRHPRGKEPFRLRAFLPRLVAPVLFLALVFGLFAYRDKFNLTRSLARIEDFRESTKPLSYAGRAPEAYRDAARKIGADMAGGQWASAAQSLLQLHESLKTGGDAAPADFRRWVDGELLVISEYAKNLVSVDAPSLYDGLEEQARQEGKSCPSFRVMKAYAGYLYNNGQVRDEMRLLGMMEAMRAEYATPMNREKDILQLEVITHLAAMPRDQKEPELTHHWKAAAQALETLKSLVGDKNKVYLKLEWDRWQRLRDDHFTWPFFVDSSTIKIDGAEIRLDQIRKQRDQFKNEYEKLIKESL